MKIELTAIELRVILGALQVAAKQNPFGLLANDLVNKIIGAIKEGQKQDEKND